MFVHWNGFDPDELASILQKIEKPNVKLNMITNRGIKVFPEGFKETFCTDHWRCRFKPSEEGLISKNDIIELLNDIIELLSKADSNGIDVIKTENLYAFDGTPAFSLGQGQ